jgi:hypothetical protein
VGFVGTWGGILGKADEKRSLSHRIKSKQSTLAAKRTVKSPFIEQESWEGVKLGSNPRKADENQSLSHRIESNQSNLAAKRTVKIPFIAQVLKARSSTGSRGMSDLRTVNSSVINMYSRKSS